MFSYCLRFLIAAVISLLLVNSLPAQEALGLNSPTPAEETTSEEAKSEATPEKKAKKDAAAEKTTAKPAKSIEETMRPEEFKAAGLDKLSEDELQHLDAYLQGYRQATQKKAAEQAKAKADEEIKKANAKADEAQKATEEAKRDAASAKTKFDSLSSRVDGNIDGVTGHTIIRLEDGSVWKQVNAVDRGDDRYRATVTDHPSVVVFHTTFGYKMRIEGMPEFYVDPVVRP